MENRVIGAGLAAALSVVALSIGGSSARADVVTLDPLHGYCAMGCSDNGTNSPTSQNPPTNFGFTVSPGPNSGDLLIDLLVPNNEAKPTSFSLSGPSGTATLFSATAWTSGNLDTYLGISASPTNPIGAYLPSTQALDPGATGFFVFQADLGQNTLQGPSNPNTSPLENITGGSLSLASYIVAFLNEGTNAAPDWVATANSGAIFETSAPPPPVPEPITLSLFGVGLVGVVAMRRRKKA